MRALHDRTDVPAPNVLFSEPEPSVLGGPFLVMERIDGRVPPDDPPYTISGWLLELAPDMTVVVTLRSGRVESWEQPQTPSR